MPVSWLLLVGIVCNEEDPVVTWEQPTNIAAVSVKE